jgi:hypothetical protein
MKRCSPFRPRVEELERRAVLAAHLTGCHALNETIHAHLGNRALRAVGNIQGGLLDGKVTLNDIYTSFTGPNFTQVAGTLTIITNQGKVRIDNSGSAGELSAGGPLRLTGTITGGTGRFKGVTGTVAVQGRFNIALSTVNATLTGMICGPPTPSS